jgi:hypothetical protein
MIYTLLCFFEPANKDDVHYELGRWTFYTELIIIFLLLSDVIIEIYHRSKDFDRDLKEKFFTNIKFLSKFFIISLLFVDFVYFY